MKARLKALICQQAPWDREYPPRQEWRSTANIWTRQVIRFIRFFGDGEREGEVWEALMSGAHYELDNFCAILDNNGCR